jgi:hypothetical protein
MSTPGTMNNLVIHTVGEDWIEDEAELRKELE